MGLNERRDIYKAIENHRQHPLIVYVTSKRDGVNASMASDALPYLIDQLEKLPQGAKELDFLIASFGGDPMVAWRMMSLIRQRVDKVSVLVPQSAYSAATLVALGADEIVMHPYSHLGPVDMQITTWSEGRPRHFSTEDISAFLDFVKERLGITDQRHLRRLFESTCREVGSLGVGFTARSSKLAIALGERLLALHKGTGDKSDSKLSLIENLSRQFHSHSYPVNRQEAIQIGLDVNAERDETLEKMMWSVWMDLEHELQEREPFSPMIELLNSGEAQKLLSPAFQMDLPLNASGPTYFQSDTNDVKGNCVSINPIDYQHIDAIMESERLGHRGVTKGKILAARQPDLSVQFNMLVNFRGWEATHQ
jgi:Serine dehydrogenase proteinase